MINIEVLGKEKKLLDLETANFVKNNVLNTHHNKKMISVFLYYFEWRI